MAENEKVPAKPETEEIATARNGRDITRGYVDGLPLLEPQDSVLRGRALADYRVYEEILRDDQVKSTFEQRRVAVVAREWAVEPGGDSALDVAAADDLRETLTRIGFDRVTDRMLYGTFYGFAASECLFSIADSRVRLDAVKVRKPRRFGFAPDGSLRLRTMQNPQGQKLPDRKFWTFTVGSDNDDDPYGIGLAHWLYWPTFFKRHGLKFWMIFLEKFGQPSAIGEYPPNATKDEQDKLLAAVSSITTDSGMIMPQGMLVRLLEAARSGTADYAALCDRMDAAISKVVLGQTMTTDDGASLSQAQVHWDVREGILKADADLVCESFTRGPATWLTEWNFPGAKVPKVFRKFANVAAVQQQANTEKTVAETTGFRPTLRHVQETYGGEWEEKPPGAAPAGPPPAFAESAAPAQDTADRMADQLEGAAGQIVDGMIDAARKVVAEARNFDELRDGLVAIYGKLDAASLSSVMERAFAAAELAGRAEVASHG
jgi:phage gp29-like protein